MRGGLADADRSRVAVAHAPLIRRCGATFPQKGKAKKLLQPNTLRQHCAFQLHQGGGFFGGHGSAYFFAVRCGVAKRGLLRRTCGQAYDHIRQLIQRIAAAKAAPADVIAAGLAQGKAQAVGSLIGVVLGAPDLQGVGVGVLLSIAQEERVLGDLVAAPNHVIRHNGHLGPCGVSRTGGYRLAKDRVGAATLGVG